jgi:hypothetical protein
MTETRMAFVRPDSPARFHHTDVDGDRLLITTADIPGVGPGLYFRTDHDGSVVSIAELSALIEHMRTIVDASIEYAIEKDGGN